MTGAGSVAHPLCNRATEHTPPHFGPFGPRCTSVRATVTPGSSAAAFAATDPGKLTVALVNESASTQTFNVQVGGFPAGSMAQWWSTQSNASIARQPDPTVSAGLVTVTLPARSIGMLVVPAAAGIDAGTGTDAGSGSSDGGPGSSGSDAGADGGSGAGTGGETSVTSTCAAAGTGAPPLLLLLILVSLHRRQS